MSDVVLQVENVSKQYRYGQLNSSSLRTDLEILHAKLHHKENTLENRLDVRQRPQRRGVLRPARREL